MAQIIKYINSKRRQSMLSNTRLTDADKRRMSAHVFRRLRLLKAPCEVFTTAVALAKGEAFLSGGDGMWCIDLMNELMEYGVRIWGTDRCVATGGHLTTPPARVVRWKDISEHENVRLCWLARFWETLRDGMYWCNRKQVLASIDTLALHVDGDSIGGFYVCHDEDGIRVIDIIEAFTRRKGIGTSLINHAHLDGKPLAAYEPSPAASEFWKKMGIDRALS